MTDVVELQERLYQAEKERDEARKEAEKARDYFEEYTGLRVRRLFPWELGDSW